MKRKILSTLVFLFSLSVVAWAANYINRVEVSNDITKYVYGIDAQGKLLYGTPWSGFSTAYCAHGNSDYVIPSSCAQVGTNAAFTASRTWTLPAANANSAGTTLEIQDGAGGVTGTNTLVIVRAGSDTINGGTSVTINNAYGGLHFVSDGTSKWTYSALPAGNPGTVTSVGLSLPSFITVTGSPITSNGTLSGTLATQTANTVFAGPTSGGAAAPTFRAQTCADLPAGAWCLLATLTASNSASLQDTTHITSAYTHYEIYLDNIIPATSTAKCKLQIHASAAWKTSSYVTLLFPMWISQSGGPFAMNPTDGIPCNSQEAQITTGPGITTHATLANPSSTSNKKMFTVYAQEALSISGNPQVYTSNIGGYWNGGNDAIDGIQLIMDAGNITSGTVKIWGHN